MTILFFFTAEEMKDQLRKDVLDLKRGLNDEINEKETIGKAADDLRNKVKRAEADKTELNRGLQDSRQKIGSKEYFIFQQLF